MKVELEKQKRYRVTVSFFEWAETDEEILNKMEALRIKTDVKYDNSPKIVSITENAWGKLKEAREIYKQKEVKK